MRFTKVRFITKHLLKEIKISIIIRITKDKENVNMKKTDELLKILNDSHDIDDVLQDHEEEFIQVSVSEYLTALIEQKNLVKSEIIKRSGIDRVYGYQILNGTRTPSRDKLIQLSFGMQLGFRETQRLLAYNGFAQLYAKNRRDSIIIFAIKEKKSVIELNLLLDKNKEKIFD